jgi:hypothetical protein
MVAIGWREDGDMLSRVLRWTLLAGLPALLMTSAAYPGKETQRQSPVGRKISAKPAKAEKLNDDEGKDKPKKNPLAGCQLCHVDVEDEYVESEHFHEKVACTECHGPSKGHVADENNEVKPDEVFARKDVDRLCSKCHDCERDIPPGWSDLPPDKRKVCSECHLAHEFAESPE